MRQKKLKSGAVILLCFGMFGLQAQQVVTTSGGNASGSGGTASYTIGQIVYTTNANSNGSVAQGVQQPYEISVITAIEDAKDINLIFSVYPNPTTDFLTLKIENYELENLSYWLYSVNGNLIETKKVLSAETQISMTNQISGTYFLKLTEGNKDVKTFKIIKN
jgi:hypothetical protein